MNTKATQRGAWRFACALAFLFGALTACGDASQPERTAAETAAPTQIDGDVATPADVASVEAASADLSAALASTFEQAQPLTDRSELASRLSLPADRIASFERAPSGPGGLSTAGEEPAVMARNDFWCGPRGCICIGDSDCNDMFSTVCRNPSTGGECRVSGRVVVCTCTLRAVS